MLPVAGAPLHGEGRRPLLQEVIWQVQGDEAIPLASAHFVLTLVQSPGFCCVEAERESC